MPRGDKTGPDGEGPKTGRGLGGCPTNSKTSNKRPLDGTGRGRGRGRGRGQGKGRGRR